MGELEVSQLPPAVSLFSFPQHPSSGPGGRLSQVLRNGVYLPFFCVDASDPSIRGLSKPLFRPLLHHNDAPAHTAWSYVQPPSPRPRSTGQSRSSAKNSPIWDELQQDLWPKLRLKLFEFGNIARLRRSTHEESSQPGCAEWLPRLKERHDGARLEMARRGRRPGGGVETPPSSGVTCWTRPPRSSTRSSSAFSPARRRSTGVRVCALTVMSTHLHALLWVDSQKQLSNFMGFVGGNLSKEVGKLIDWSGALWSDRYHMIPVSDEDGVQISRLKYVLGNSVKEGLVSRPQDWPGINSAQVLIDGEPLTGVWIGPHEAGRGEAAQERGRQRREVLRGGDAAFLTITVLGSPTGEGRPPPGGAAGEGNRGRRSGRGGDRRRESPFRRSALPFTEGQEITSAAFPCRNPACSQGDVRGVRLGCPGVSGSGGKAQGRGSRRAVP